MTPESIWASEQLRQEWINSISDKAVDIFEKIVRAENPREPKTKAGHAADTGIPTKYIERPLRFLKALRLLSYQKTGDYFQIDYSLPVTTIPPNDVNWELWATNVRKNAGFSVKYKQSIYNLDRGVCAYCEQPVRLEEASIDHIYPDSKGGADTEPNHTIACGDCNSEKWSWIPGDPNYLTPKRFRGRRVKSVSFVKVDGFLQPEFEFCKEGKQ